MSLNDNDRTALVRLYMEKARQTLHEADIAKKEQAWGMAANRLYYAMFHAAGALFVNDGIAIGTHRGVKALFGQNYILTGKFSAEHSKLLARMETLRDKADYNVMFVATEEDIESNMPLVKDFIIAIEKYIGTEGL